MRWEQLISWKDQWNRESVFIAIFLQKHLTNSHTSLRVHLWSIPEFKGRFIPDFRCQQTLKSKKIILKLILQDLDHSLEQQSRTKERWAYSRRMLVRINPRPAIKILILRCILPFNKHHRCHHKRTILVSIRITSVLVLTRQKKFIPENTLSHGSNKRKENFQ